MLRALCCCAYATAASRRAKIRSASAGSACSLACSASVLSAVSASAAVAWATLALASAGTSLAGALSPLSFSGSAGGVASTLACGLSASRSGRLTLRLCQPTSGNFCRSGPTAFGQSAVSPAPGTMMTAPCGSLSLAGFQRPGSCRHRPAGSAARPWAQAVPAPGHLPGCARAGAGAGLRRPELRWWWVVFGIGSQGAEWKDRGQAAHCQRRAIKCGHESTQGQNDTGSLIVFARDGHAAWPPLPRRACR